MAEQAWSNSVFVDGRWVAYRDLLGETTERLAPYTAYLKQGRYAFAVQSAREALGVAAFAQADQLDGAIVAREKLTPGVATALRTAGLALDPATPPAPEFPRRAGTITLLTSGSTGAPKAIQHTWATLTTFRRPDATPHRWLLPYDPGTYAWYQLVALAGFTAGQDLVPVTPSDPANAVAVAAAAGVSAVSSTPTFWRVLLLRVGAAALASLPVRQITLGGERVDQQILDTLRGLYPAARITHIYASTEAGACIVVHDQLAGFPAVWLAERDEHLRVSDGRLHVRSAHTMSAAVGHSDAWIDTGDLVEVRGDRVVVIGRAGNAIINVGGAKVQPADVEAVLLGVEGVRWARVTGVRAPLVGQLPVADLVADGTITDAMLTDVCARHLPAHAVPRAFRFLSEIPVSGNAKTSLELKP